MEDSPADEVIKSLSAYKIVDAAMESSNKHAKINSRVSLPPLRGSKDNRFNNTDMRSNQRRVDLTAQSENFTDAVVTSLGKRNKFIEAAFNKVDELDELEDERDRPLVQEDEEDEVKISGISKEELLFLVSMFKAELQTKDMALTAIKYEQLKRLMNPIEISRSSMADAYMKLQDRLQQRRDRNNNCASKKSPSQESEEGDNKNVSKENVQQTADRSKEDSEKLHILNLLLELLDQHPLLAFSRDSLYCFDYNFDEQSTKNYLNLKINHLENMVRQHRTYRHFMNKRLRECEASLFNLSKELEMEKNNRLERVESILEAKEKYILERKVEKVQTALEEEKRTKLLIVMTILAELNEERDKINFLAKHNSSLKKQNVKLEEKMANDKIEYENLIKDLSLENSMLKLKLERRGSVTNLVKPQVPAKPAQLLDQKQISKGNPTQKNPSLNAKPNPRMNSSN